MTPPLVIPPYLKEAPLTGLIGMGGGATSRHFYTASSSDSYQIGKSLRFDEDDSPSLELSNSGRKGNRQTWTLSYWCKRGKNGVYGEHFASKSGTPWNTFQFHTSDQYQFNWGAGDGSGRVQTDAYFRDCSAWYHICLVWDTTHVIDTERVRIYFNGIRQSVSNSGGWPTQGEASPTGGWNDSAGTTYIGGGGPDTNKDALADIQHIDGLAIGPSAFGEFDTAGNWLAKTFALPTPNQGVTHSSTLTSSTGSWYSSSYNATRPFNNNIDWTGASTDSSTGSCTWTPATEIPFTHSVKTHSNVCDIALTLTDDRVINVRAANDENKYVYYGNSKIKSIKWTPTSAGNYTDVQAIWVDGVLLVDGATDPETRNNPNNGTTWSHYVTGTAYTNQDGDKAFDGLTSTLSQASNPGEASLTFKPPAAITGRVEILIAAGLHGGAVTGEFDLKIGNVSKFDNSIWPNNTTGWVDLGTNTIDTTHGLVWGNSSGGNWHGIKMIKVDGQVLIDGSIDRSFHLKFADTSSASRLGRDSYDKGIDDTSVDGGLPIYNTTAGSDGYDQGETKGSGYRTDSSAGTTDGTGLVFALPGDVLTDEHDHINTGSSAVTLTTNGDPAVDTTYSRFYGSSIAFDGTGDYLSNSSSNSDFTFGTGDFTVECWVTKSAITHKGFWQISSTAGGLNQSDYANTLAVGCYVSGSNAQWQWYGGGGSGESAVYPIGVNKWYHMAYVRSSSVSKLYINGKVVLTRSSDTNDYDGTYVSIGGYYNTSYLHNGNIQDFRIYKGVAKYTAEFTPPSRNDFTVNNLVAASSEKIYTSNHATWNSLTWDGSLTTTGGVTGGSYTTLTDQSITVNTLFEIYTNDENGQINTIKDGDGNEYQCDAYAGTGSYWRPLFNANSQSGTNFTGTLTGPIQIKVSYGGSHIYAIRADGTILADSYYTDTSTDTPTNGGTDSGLGGEVTGNYCTWDFRANMGGLTLSQQNLKQYWAGSGWKSVLGTMSVSGGKWYYEYTCDFCETTPDDHQIGWADVFDDGGQSSWANYGDRPGDQKAYVYYNTGATRYNSTSNDNSGYDSWLSGDVIGIALDLDNGKIFFAKNGTWQGSSDPAAGTNAAYTSVSTTSKFTPVVGNWSNSSQKRSGHANFGQLPFKYTAPTGFKTVCSQNVADTFGNNDDTNDPSKYFEAVKWYGDGTTSQEISSLDFSPGLNWIKNRETTNGQMITDALRGATKVLFAHQTAVEATETNSVTSFDSDGFTLGGWANNNTLNEKYGSWNWYAGASAATPSSSGTITPGAQWVNDTSGFSITKYEVPGDATFTVGHGLSAAPHFILQKNLDSANNWDSYHIGVGATKRTKLNSDDGPETQGGVWNNTAPTSTVFSQQGNSTWYTTGNNIITYCWRPIAGYSAFGYYSGNNSTDGPRLHFGFRPRFMLIKGTSSPTSWVMIDSERDDDGNPTGNTTYLKANTNDSEQADGAHEWGDFLSNGFKHNQNGGWHNASSQEYFYAAWAENPFKTARAV